MTTTTIPTGQAETAVHVSDHACARYIERVANVSWDEATAALRSRAIQAAAEFGAPYVRLPGGQRVVLKGRSVVTVLSRGSPPKHLMGEDNAL